MSEDVGNLAVRLGMDSSNFQTGMTQINRSLRVLNSEFSMNTSAIGLNGTALDRLRLRSSSLSSTMTQQQQRVNALEAAHERSVTATGRDSAATQNLEIRLNQARASLSNMGNELATTNAQIATQSSRWTRMGTTLSNLGDRLGKIGTSLKNVGGKLTTSVTAPILALGVASAKMGLDFEASMAKVSTISDDTQVPLGDLRKAILKLSSDTGIAATDIADNVYDAISAGQSTADAVNFVTNSTKLAKSGFAEAGQSLDLLTTILNSYGLKSSEVNKVSDILVQTQNKGKVTVGELSDSMGKIIPTANAVGVNLEQVASGYAIMTSKGIKAAESTTYMAGMLNEMSKSGSLANKTIKASTGKTFPELIKSGKSVGDILNSMNVYAKKNGKSLTDMFGSAEAGKAALVLSGNQGKDFNEMLKSMGEATGETDKAFEKVNNTAGMKLTKSLNSLKNAGIKMGDALAPIVEKISGAIQKLADKFNALTPAQQENIVKIGLLVAAIGPALSIIGSLVTVVGGISSALGVVSTAMGVTTVATAGVGVAGGVASGGIGALGVAFGAALLPLAPWILGIGAVIGTGYLVKKAFEEEITPSVDLFADNVVTTTSTVSGANARMATSYETTVTKISDGTKKAVGAYMDLDTKAEKSLTTLYVNSTIITAKNSEAIVLQYQEMSNKIKTELDRRYNEELATMTAFFAKSSALSKTEEENALIKLKTDNDNRKIAEDNLNKQIKAIMKIASDQKRALTLDEQVKINGIQDKMKTNAITTLSENEVQAKIILQRIKDFGANITAQQASEIVKNANKARDGSVKGANDTYTKSIATIIKMRDESHSITSGQADKLIADANRQKDETIKKAEEMRNGAVSKVRNMNKDIDDSVNMTTGNMRTKWDNFKSWWSKLFFSKKTLEVDSKNTSYVETGKLPASTSYRYNIPRNSSGTNNFDGGLTTMHEKGYEVYNLNKGSQILNHEASLDLITKTAETVARGVLGSMTENNNNRSFPPIKIIVPLNIDGREVARATAQPMAEELQFYMNQNSLGGR